MPASPPPPTSSAPSSSPFPSPSPSPSPSQASELLSLYPAQPSRRFSASEPVSDKFKLSRAVRYRDLTCPRLKVIHLPDGSHFEVIGTHAEGRSNPLGGEANGKPGKGFHCSSPDHSHPHVTYAEHDWKRFQDKNFIYYGLGLSLYFKLLKNLAWIVLFCSILTIPAIVFSLSSDEGVDRNAGLERTTIGMFGANLASSTIYDSIPIAGTSINKSTLALLLASLDTLICLILFLWSIYMSKAQAKEALSYQKVETTISHYSVQVTNLSPFFSDRLDLEDFFTQRFGPVADIALVYNDQRLLELYATRGALKLELDVAVSVGQITKIEPIVRHMAFVDEQIEILRTEPKMKRKTIAAFITFESQESKIKCIRAYSSYWSGWLRKRGVEDLLAFQGRNIVVTSPNEPSNIFFRNLKYSRRNKLGRRLLTFIVTILLLLFSMTIVFVAHFYTQKLPTQEECDTVVTFSQAEANPDLVDCYCSSLSIASAISISGISCAHYIKLYILSNALSSLSVVTIVVINFVLKFLIKVLADFEKHASVTKLQQTITTKLFVALFINTALILLAVNANFQAYIGNLGFTLAFDGEYEDFTYGWFKKVGSSILLTMIINIINPHLLPVMCVSYQRCRRKGVMNTGKLSQDQLNKKFRGFNFNLAERYAILLNNVFSSFLYSSGLPLLFLLLSVTMFCNYLCDKISFFGLYAIPPRYDEYLAQYTMAAFPYAIWLHLAFALWFFTAPVLTEYSLVPDTDGVLGYQYASLQDRLVTRNTAPLAVLLVVISCYILSTTSFRFLSLPFSSYSRRAVVPVSTLSSKGFKTFSESSKDIKFESFHSYRAEKYASAFLGQRFGLLNKPLSLATLRERREALSSHLRAKQESGAIGPARAEQLYAEERAKLDEYYSSLGWKNLLEKQRWATQDLLRSAAREAAENRVKRKQEKESRRKSGRKMDYNAIGVAGSPLQHKFEGTKPLPRSAFEKAAFLTPEQVEMMSFTKKYKPDADWSPSVAHKTIVDSQESLSSVPDLFYQPEHHSSFSGSALLSPESPLPAAEQYGAPGGGQTLPPRERTPVFHNNFVAEAADPEAGLSPGLSPAPEDQNSPSDFCIVRIVCPGCSESIQVLDVGEVKVYECPLCKSIFEM